MDQWVILQMVILFIFLKVVVCKQLKINWVVTYFVCFILNIHHLELCFLRFEMASIRRPPCWGDIVAMTRQPLSDLRATRCTFTSSQTLPSEEEDSRPPGQLVSEWMDRMECCFELTVFTMLSALIQ